MPATRKHRCADDENGQALPQSTIGAIDISDVSGAKVRRHQIDPSNSAQLFASMFTTCTRRFSGPNGSLSFLSFVLP